MSTTLNGFKRRLYKFMEGLANLANSHRDPKSSEAGDGRSLFPLSQACEHILRSIWLTTVKRNILVYVDLWFDQAGLMFTSFLNINTL